MLAGEEPVEQRGADAADVQVAGRAGSEAGADHETVARGVFGPAEVDRIAYAFSFSFTVTVFVSVIVLQRRFAVLAPLTTILKPPNGVVVSTTW